LPFGRLPAVIGLVPRALFIGGTYYTTFFDKKSIHTNYRSKKKFAVNAPLMFPFPKTKAANAAENVCGIIHYSAIGFMVGKSRTSRIDAASVRNITRRSMPIPRPPVGGIPNSKARRKSSSISLASSSPLARSSI